MINDHFRGGSIVFNASFGAYKVPAVCFFLIKKEKKYIENIRSPLLSKALTNWVQKNDRVRAHKIQMSFTASISSARFNKLNRMCVTIRKNINSTSKVSVTSSLIFTEAFNPHTYLLPNSESSPLFMCSPVRQKMHTVTRIRRLTISISRAYLRRSNQLRVRDEFRRTVISSRYHMKNGLPS